MGGLDDVEQSEDEVRDDPEHEAHDGPEEEQALGPETVGNHNTLIFFHMGHREIETCPVP